MATVPRVISRTQKKLYDAKQMKLELIKQQKLNEQEIKKQEFLSKVESIIKENPGFLEDIKCLISDMEADTLDSVVESLVVTTVENNEEIFEDVSESEDRIESPVAVITDGPIIDSEVDENVSVDDNNIFSNDGRTATKQMIDKLNLVQDYIIISVGPTTRNPKCYFKIKYNDKLVVIENHDTKQRHDFGLITTIDKTNDSSVVQNWDKFGRSNAKRRKYDFKGKNIEDVVSMIRDILS